MWSSASLFLLYIANNHMQWLTTNIVLNKFHETYIFMKNPAMYHFNVYIDFTLLLHQPLRSFSLGWISQKYKFHIKSFAFSQVGITHVESFSLFELFIYARDCLASLACCDNHAVCEYATWNACERICTFTSVNTKHHYTYTCRSVTPLTNTD